MKIYLYKNIQTLRKRKKISQERLGDNLKITRARIEGWESNRNDVPTKYIVALSDFFGVKIDKLIRHKYK